MMNQKTVRSMMSMFWKVDGIQPHPNLKNLVVVNYLRTRFPSWFNKELLPNLVEL